jgi:hypothetical protein
MLMLPERFGQLIFAETQKVMKERKPKNWNGKRGWLSNLPLLFPRSLCYLFSLSFSLSTTYLHLSPFLSYSFRGHPIRQMDIIPKPVFLLLRPGIWLWRLNRGWKIVFYRNLFHCNKSFFIRVGLIGH